MEATWITEGAKLQATVLIPQNEDLVAGNGKSHPDWKWKKLLNDFYVNYRGWTATPDLYLGGWIDESGKRVEEQSRKFYIDIDQANIEIAKAQISSIAKLFCQRCIRFEIAGFVEYIGQNDYSEIKVAS